MKDPRFTKFVILVNGAVPLAMIVWDAYWQQLGANPPERALHTTGVMAITFLTLSLAITPVRKLTGWNWLSHFRRMLGVYAFFYGVVHLLIYLRYYVAFSLIRIWDYSTHNLFVFYGMAALLLMAPLAATSTNGMIKRMGSAKWKLLHRLVYPAGILAVLHYYNVGKAVPPPSRLFAGILALLLLYRLIAPILASSRKKSKPVSATS